MFLSPPYYRVLLNFAVGEEALFRGRRRQFGCGLYALACQPLKSSPFRGPSERRNLLDQLDHHALPRII